MRFLKYAFLFIKHLGTIYSDVTTVCALLDCTRQFIRIPTTCIVHTEQDYNMIIRDLPGYGWVPCAAAGGWFGVEGPGVGLTSETEGGR